MKSIYKMKYAMAAMVLLITSCQGSDLLEGGDKVASGNKVEHINATIQGLQSSRANTEDTGNAWTEGDMIELYNYKAPEGKQVAEYKYNSSTGKFELASSNYVVWNEADNVFYACYPAFGRYAEEVSSQQVKDFNLPSDQTTIENLRSADLMYLNNNFPLTKPDNNELSVQFAHVGAKVVVNITKYNDEYGDLPVISDPVFTSLTRTNNEQFFTVPDVNIKGYMKKDETGNGLHTFMAILQTGQYSEGDVFLKFNVNGVEQQVLANSTLTAGLGYGKSYTFNLTVGKNKVSIASVEVADWAGGFNKDAGTADETKVLVDAATHSILMTEEGALTEDAVKAAIGSSKSLVLKGKMNEDDFPTLSRALSQIYYADESGDPINVDMSEVNVAQIPRSAFGSEHSIEHSFLGEVKLPETVKMIGDYAFADITSCKIVNLNELTSLAYIGYKAFGNTATEGALELPSSLKILEASAFAGAKITSVVVPAGVRKMTFCTFGYNTSLKTITYLGDMKDTEYYNTFAGCTALESVDFSACTAAPGVSSNNRDDQDFNPDNVTLYVNAAAKASFEESDFWSKFNIQEKE